MLCEQAANLIAARLDGELPPDDRDALDAHLADCPDCRALTEAFHLQHAELRGAFAERRAAVVMTAQRSVARLRPGGKRQRWVWGGAGLLAAAAAVAGVCLILWDKQVSPPRS